MIFLFLFFDVLQLINVERKNYGIEAEALHRAVP